MEQQTFTRKELYDLVWSEPMLTLSKKYNISDVGLRKMCTRMGIPMPRAGHWQKLKFQKKVPKMPLPSNYSGDEKVTLTLRDEKTPFPIKGESPLSVLVHQINNDHKLNLKVPDRLTNPDKLIISAKNELLGKKPDTYQYLGSVGASRDQLDIRVSQANVARALRFMDTLIKALRARGHDITFRNGDTYAIVMDHDFKILLREKHRREVVKDGNWDRSIYHPTGVLYFQIHGYPTREWKDGKLPLEEQLPRIIAQFELSGQEWKELREKQRIEEEARIEKQRLQKEFEERQESELRKFKKMLSSASRWHKAENLRNYIKEVEAKALGNGNISYELKNWLEWARQKADWYDPFTEAKDELLDEINKDTLELPKRNPYYGW
jgi:hypothetical protein